MEPLIKRLLVSRHTGQIQPALVDELIETLCAAAPSAARRAARDVLLRAAANLLEGSPWQRAGTVVDLIRQFRHPADEVRRLLWLAERNAPLPESVRQVYRIISSC